MALSMGTPMWRSQPMQLVQLFVQIEAAHDTVDELGQLGLIQFRDFNPEVNAFQRNFVGEVKRCDEMERKVRFFEDQVTREGLGNSLSNIAVDGPSAVQASVDELEARFDELEKELQQMNQNQQMLNRNYNELVELKYVITKDAVFFNEAGRADFGQGNDGDHVASPLLAAQEDVSSASRGVKLGFVTGVILRDKMASFERVLWRVARGNLYLKQADIEEPIKDPSNGDDVEKNVFIVFFQGERLQQKIKKICESFGANLYPCPETARERQDLLNQVTGRLADLEVVVARSSEHRRQVLSNVAVQLRGWKEKVIKEKAIYHTMNLFNYDLGRKCLVAEGWCPKTATEDIQLALRRATTRSGALVPSILSVVKANEVPPTYFETNKYTAAFQNIVDAYGVAHYREVNPAVLTIVTFPFLFGVMFGDVGHGIIMLLFSFFLLYKEKDWSKKKLNEILQMPYDGRYVLLLMSLFGIYCGFIYNECFSLPMDLFGTRWANPPGNTTVNIYKVFNNETYPFGVDPAWKGAPNELDYYNSFKMKLSVIFGVSQMTLGIIISLLNYTEMKYPHNVINIVFQFIPQMIFLWSLFGYMCILIVIKWVTNWNNNPLSPPYILPLIINMFLSPSGPVDPPLIGNQILLQQVLVVLALLAVPTMLFPKPLILRHMHNKRVHSHHHLEEEEEDDGHGGHGAFDFGEIMIHQIIHTIEFVLGAISNTASYLRLWALSLAHSELSTVFYDRILVGELVGGNPALAFVGFAIWAAGTISVLLVMESLSAFLHALRLHWVEFQNKFYLGDGKKFAPFSYEKILTGTDTDE